MQADGKILAVGPFNNIGGQPRKSIARLDAVTGLADSWNANSNDTVNSIAVQADGKILARWRFHGANSIGGQMRNHIARLDAVTGLADSWDPNSDGQVYSIAVQPDGKILAGGNFTNIGGQPRKCIARLDAVTGLADSFDPGTTSSFNDVFSIAVQADGKVLVSGDFHGIVGRTDAQPYRPARCGDRIGRFVRPEREQYCPCCRGAAGRQNISGRHFHEHRRTAAQHLCPFEQRHRRTAKYCGDANHRYLDARRLQPAILRALPLSLLPIT